MKYYAIVVGGGSGSRMQTDIPKQFLSLQGKPVLMHTLEAFHLSDFHPEIILVLNIEFHSYWEKLCKDHNFTIPHELVSGGLQRFHSVKNGLKRIKGSAIVAIHDAVRPFIRKDIIDMAYHEAALHGSVVTAVKSRDSVRQRMGPGSISLDREDIYLIQTPQVFQSAIIKKAYQQDYRNEFTDDASVAERSGAEIKLIEGDQANIKITFPLDITLGEIYLNEKN